MKKVSVFGDSILKGVQYNQKSGRYVVEDNIGFDGIAERAGYSVQNFSKLGCTVTKAWNYLQKMFPKIDADLVFMDFGGNDCDFDWKAISDSPLNIHKPNTEYYDFIGTYNNMVDYILSKRRMPVLATLVPIQADEYIEYVVSENNLDRRNINKWLGGDVKRIENYQRVYSDAVKGIASRRDIPYIDIRAAFEANGDTTALMCRDGIHPNDRGQAVIHDCFEAFLEDFIVL